MDMNRRSFLAGLLALPFAPKVAEALKPADTVTTIEVKSLSHGGMFLLDDLHAMYREMANSKFAPNTIIMHPSVYKVVAQMSPEFMDSLSLPRVSLVSSENVGEDHIYGWDPRW